jgi:hypothetical protein
LRHEEPLTCIAVSNTLMCIAISNTHIRVNCGHCSVHSHTKQ